nr:hypothetical protein [Herbihabitans rhizosphaerae]
MLLLILLIVSASSIAISAGMPTGTAKNIVSAVSIGTMVSAIVGFGQTLITASAAQRATVTPLIEENRRALAELSAEYRSLNSEFFPTHVFEATTAPDPAFNRRLMEDLANTRQYAFRGFSGRHAAARLLTSPAAWELRAVVADPRELSGISGRARHLARQAGPAADYDAIQALLHDEIRIGLVGLFLARGRCERTDVFVVPDPPLDRLEMFDDSAWITLYSDSAGTTKLYPRTLRFSHGSFIYNMQRAEFTRITSSRDTRHLAITPTTTRREFVDQFEEVTGTRLREKQFTELEDKFHSFRQDFSVAAELGS